eukprot:XP_002938786.3 PREDICTED: interleukin-22 receptor subunit alpha-1 [Xenopus tropicalis]
MKKGFYFLFFCFIYQNFSYGCKQFSRQNVTFQSVNFEFILQWDREDLREDVVFSVQYKRYGDKEWSIKHECQNISRTFCNLTNEIAGDVHELFEHEYYGRVRASSKYCHSDWVMSERVYPREHTHIGQPAVQYVKDVNSITIFVYTPYVPVKNKGGEPQSVQDLYHDMLFKYHVSLSIQEKHSMWQKSQADNKFEVTGLKPNTKYNGSVYILVENIRKSDIHTFVVQTLPDHSLFTLIVCGFAVSVLFLIIVLMYLSYRYVSLKGTKTPKSLVLSNIPAAHPMKPLKDYHLCSVSYAVSDTKELPADKNEPNDLQKPGEIAYKTQSQTTIRNFDSTFPKSSNCLQQSVDYGMVEERTVNKTSYLANPQTNLGKLGKPSLFPSNCSNQMDQSFLLTAISNVDDGNQKMTERLRETTESFRSPKMFCFDEAKSLRNQNENSLIHTVIVQDLLDLEEPKEQVEDLSILLSQDSTNHNEVTEVTEPAILPSVNTSYVFQCPLKNTQTDLQQRALSNIPAAHPMKPLKDYHLCSVLYAVSDTKEFPADKNEPNDLQKPGEIAYKTQSQTTIRNFDSTFPKSSNCLQQSVDYGMVEERTVNKTSYLANPQTNLGKLGKPSLFPSNCSNQMDQSFLLTAISNVDDGNQKMTERLRETTESFRSPKMFCFDEAKSLRNQNENSLIHTVIVQDLLDLEEPKEQVEDLSILLSQDSTNHNEVTEVTEPAILPSVNTSYVFQCPLKNTQTDLQQRVMVCQQPYKMQHCHVSKV